MMNRFFTLLLAASCLTAVGQVPDYVPTDGLVAWFDFGLGQEDQSGNLELILNGGAQLADGVLDVSQSGAWAESSELPPSLEGAPAFSVVAVLQSQMSHYDAASWGIGGGSPIQNINSWNHSSGAAANQVTVDLWGETTFGSGLEYSQEDFDIAFWSKTAGNFSAGNILLGLNEQVVEGADLTSLRNGLELPDLPEGGKLYLGKAGSEDNYYGPFQFKIFGLFDRALDVEEYELLRLNMMEELEGCTDISACNYSPEAFIDDGSCESFGCMDSHACNFDAEAACDEGNCDYSCCPGPGCCGEGMFWDWNLEECVIINPSDSNFDGCVQLNDLLDLLSAYGDCGAEELAWQCGDPLQYQGYDYETVHIGEQCWFAENLRAENYQNGETIPAGLSDVEWANTVFGAVTLYASTYGRLYNWYAVDDFRGLCPPGWHVPTDSEWMTTEIALGMTETEVIEEGVRGTNQGTQMKTDYGWYSGGNGTNSSGFSGLPGGARLAAGNYANVGSLGYWWSSSTIGGLAWKRVLFYSNEGVFRTGTDHKEGSSIRCIKD